MSVILSKISTRSENLITGMLQVSGNALKAEGKCTNEIGAGKIHLLQISGRPSVPLGECITSFEVE